MYDSTETVCDNKCLNCYHSMAHPWVADGDRLQVWRAAANIEYWLNN
jgi:hypothetical protein